MKGGKSEYIFPFILGLEVLAVDGQNSGMLLNASLKIRIIVQHQLTAIRIIAQHHAVNPIINPDYFNAPTIGQICSPYRTDSYSIEHHILDYFNIRTYYTYVLLHCI